MPLTGTQSVCGPMSEAKVFQEYRRASPLLLLDWASVLSLAVCQYGSKQSELI